MNTPGTLTYVYAVTRPTDRLHEALAGLRGIGMAPARLLISAPVATPGSTPGAAPGSGPVELAFVASDVPVGDFNETALKDHFEDLNWLEDVARTHHDVVQAVAAHATVLPLRMATVYQDDQRARQALTDRHDTFAQRLDLLHAHTEYGVKIYLDPAAAGPQPPAAEAPSTPAAPTSPGKAYLRARRAQHHAREAVHQQARQAAEAIEGIAARHTTLRVRHAPQSGTLTGSQENVLNDAYLIPDDQADRFRAAIADAARAFPDVRIEVTGPWAPYSFAMPPADPPGPADADGPPP
ncbi:GvpL/GvpF family gas vesicle protein [Streptomyces sp. NPDC048349]|uniref:GvpL/GvpF family gas vesicle protein n=1 Tax=Streptomyces sp. NPDC048349 TaxID=3155486 RepID=UPI003445B0A2